MSKTVSNVPKNKGINVPEVPIVKNLYAIRDLKVGTFMAPFIAENNAAVVRQFGDLVMSNDKNSLTLHPDDFAVFYLGAFLVETGDLVPSPEGIKMLATGSDFSRKE